MKYVDEEVELLWHTRKERIGTTQRVLNREIELDHENYKAKQQRQRLYLANKHILAIMTLGMTSSHGLAVNQKTVSTDFPQAKAYSVIEILKQKCKPSDVCAELSWIKS